LVLIRYFEDSTRLAGGSTPGTGAIATIHEAVSFFSAAVTLLSGRLDVSRFWIYASGSASLQA